MKFVIATANPNKIKEMREILTDLGIDVVTREEMGIFIDVEETGTTFFENSLLKANAIMATSKMPAIADDSGLAVEALDGEPGVYSSSYGGENLSSHKRCEYLLDKMKDTEHRKAKFICIINCVFPNGDLITAEGECLGSITHELRGTSGFGYDPVFKPNGFEKTMAELTPAEKNEISHRGKALSTFHEFLKSYNSGNRI